mmetsp:Transcript_115185/g.273817  ORF Transcript_115185/g.273817 Transcript_115185/m.273817 type:complete len:339 (+) Transcript_115185:318-1334(+)
MTFIQPNRGVHVGLQAFGLLLHKLHVLGVGDDALLEQLPHLLGTLHLPTHRVSVLDDPHGAPSVDLCPVRVMHTGLHKVILVPLRRATLHGSHKSRAHPHCVGAQRQGHGQVPPISDASCGNDGHLLAGERRLVALAQVHHHRDQNAGGDIPGVASTFAALRTNDVHSRLQGFLHVLGGTNHIHHWNASSMELVHRILRRHPHSAHKELGTHLDGNVNQLREVALRVVIVRGPCVPANLRDEQVHPKGRVGILQRGLELLELGSEHLRRVVYSSPNAKATSVGHRGSQLRTGGDVHACQKYGVLNAKQLRHRSLDLRQRAHGDDLVLSEVVARMYTKA